MLKKVVLFKIGKKCTYCLKSGSSCTWVTPEFQRVRQCTNPLEFWARHQHSYPALYQIARRVFGALATEANCERMFSRSGAVLSAKRMSMEPALASATTILSKEHELFALSATDFGAYMMDSE